MLTERDFKLALIGIAFTVAAFVAFFWLLGCDEPTDGCMPKETRCEGPTLQVCSEDQQWFDWMKCTDLEPDEWVCCDVDGGAECLKVEECQR